MRAQLGHLGRDRRLAIRLLRVRAVVALVMLFGREEPVEGRDLGHDRVRPDLRGVELGDERGRGRFLLGRVREDRGAVLGAHVGALTVQGRRVVQLEEVLKLQPKFHNGIVTEVTAAPHFWPAEDYHQDYFTKNPNNRYCRAMIPPKLQKLGLDVFKK